MTDTTSQMGAPQVLLYRVCWLVVITSTARVSSQGSRGQGFHVLPSLDIAMETIVTVPVSMVEDCALHCLNILPECNALKYTPTTGLCSLLSVPTIAANVSHEVIQTTNTISQHWGLMIVMDILKVGIVIDYSDDKDDSPTLGPDDLRGYTKGRYSYRLVRR